MQPTQIRFLLVSALAVIALALSAMPFFLRPAHVTRLGTPSAHPPYAALAADAGNTRVATITPDEAAAGATLQPGATVAVCSTPVPMKDDGTLAYSVYMFVPSDFVTMYGGSTDWQGPIFYSKAFAARNPAAATTYDANTLPAGAYYIWTAQAVAFSCATGIVPVGGSAACSPQECGPLQNFPSIQCLNNSEPRFLCKRAADGKCGYVPVCSGGTDASSAVSGDLASCLPSGHTIDELDSRVYPAGQTVPTTYGIAASGNQYGIHLGDFLSHMGAHCTDGGLRDSAGNSVLFSSTIPCGPGGAITAAGYAQFNAEAARWNQEVASLLPQGTVVISGYCVPLP